MKFMAQPTITLEADNSSDAWDKVNAMMNVVAFGADSDQLRPLIKFVDQVLMFQDVDDVLSGKIEEWLDMDKEIWEVVISTINSLRAAPKPIEVQAGRPWKI